jgi:CheY-like chemotaxis protein
VDGETTARVLVVDDDADVRGVICEALLFEGYHVVSARSGAVALELIGALEEAQPDVILLDMQMPAMDGPEFVRRYRRTPGPHAALLALTGADDPVRYVEDVRADGFLVKPFDVGTLVELVERSVGRRSRLAS